MLRQLGRGVVWTYASMGISGALQLAVVAVTARLLPAEAFGLVAMANVVLRFGSYFADMGVGRALIQRQHIDADDVRAAFTSSSALGVATAAVIAAIAPVAAAYYQDADVATIMRWLALTFVFTGLGATSRALLQRQLRFRASGAVEVASYALGYALPTLVLATNGFGVWSLVAGAVGQAVVASTITMALARHGWRPMLRWAPHARLFRFGATVSGISVLEFLGSTLDTLVIGRYGSAAQVGLYNRAFTLASLPTYQVNHGITKVLFPVLSAGRSDSVAFAKTLETATSIAIRVVVPLGVGLSMAAPELVSVVLGDAWGDAVPLLAILAPALALNLLATFPGQALDAVGKLRWKAITQFAYVLLLGAGLVVYAEQNLALQEMVTVVATGIAFRTAALFVVAVRTGAAGTSLLTASLRWAALSATVSVASFAGVRWLLQRADASNEVSLVLLIVTGAGIVLALLGSDVVRLLRERDRRRLESHVR